MNLVFQSFREGTESAKIRKHCGDSFHLLIQTLTEWLLLLQDTFNPHDLSKPFKRTKHLERSKSLASIKTGSLPSRITCHQTVKASHTDSKTKGPHSLGSLVFPLILFVLSFWKPHHAGILDPLNGGEQVRRKLDYETKSAFNAS